MSFIQVAQKRVPQNHHHNPPGPLDVEEIQRLRWPLGEFLKVASWGDVLGFSEGFLGFQAMFLLIVFVPF